MGLWIAVAIAAAQQTQAACEWESQPIDAFSYIGGTASFTATLKGTTAAVTHTWNKNGGAAIKDGDPTGNGSTYKIVTSGTNKQTSTLSINNVQIADFCAAAKGFQDTATDGGCGAAVVSKRVALIKLECAWAIQPTDAIGRVGDVARYTAQVIGVTGAVKHTWKKNGGAEIKDGDATGNGSEYRIFQDGPNGEASSLLIVDVKAADFCTAANGFQDTVTGGGCGTLSSSKVALIQDTQKDDITDYATQCYTRLGIDKAKFEAAFGKELDMSKDAPGRIQMYTKQQGKIRDLELNGKANPDKLLVPPTDCDYPVWLGSGRSEDKTKGPYQCYGNSFLRVFHIDGKVDVALFCRKKTRWTANFTDFDDINMVMHNPSNGQTCWFNTQDGFIFGDPPQPPGPPGPPFGGHRSVSKDGTKIPAPHLDTTGFWLKPSQAAGIGCISCHDNGPWMNSRWLHTLLAEKNIQLRDKASGPYFNEGAGFSSWAPPKFITVDAAKIYDKRNAAGVRLVNNRCTSCHKIHAGFPSVQQRVTSGGMTGLRWLNYSIGAAFPPQSDANPGQKFDIAYWMPCQSSKLPSATIVDATDAANWKDLYQSHVDALKACIAKHGVNDGPGSGDPCHVLKSMLPAPPAMPTPRAPDAPAVPIPGSGVTLYADAGGVTYQSTAPSNPPLSPIPISYGTPLSLSWSSDATHPYCHVSTTFPPGVEVNGIGTGSNWLLNESPQNIGALTVPGEYYFHIDCDDDNYDQIAAGLIFKIEGPSPTVLRVESLVGGVGTTAFDYPAPARPHVVAPVSSPTCASITWSASNVMAGSCILTETLTPSSGNPPRVFADESGFINAPLYGQTDQKYELTCTGLDGLPHSVDLTLQVTLSTGWNGDTDGDGAPDCADNCPDDPNKTEPGKCGCGTADIDGDGDGTPDCQDDCPADPNKVLVGVCGCGVIDSVCGACGTPDPDSDADGVPDCLDQCSNDPDKTAPGTCGCGTPDPVCGGPCGTPDPDADADGTPDCLDQCPNDPNKIEPERCGCGVLETDTDSDGTPDCLDQCPNDPNKTSPGTCGCGTIESMCGCGVPEVDSDGDGTPDCIDACQIDPNKTDPGTCGCGTLESVCGCGVPEVDSDLDGWPDCIDLCPDDAKKIAPGQCGCGIPEGSCPCGDLDHDGDVDADDFARFVSAYGRSMGDSNYNAEADYDHNGIIGLNDYQAWLACYRTFIHQPQAAAPLQILGDFDLSGHVDSSDALHWWTCRTGAQVGPPIPVCSDADLDRDGDVDMDDFGILQRCMTGSGPINVGCR